MLDVIKDELEQYKDLLIEHGFSDIESLKGKRLKTAIKVINRYKREKEMAENIELDRIFLKKIRIFL
ncbi:hypothetical protein QA289_10970 [Glaesserella parasuis]|uniref:hypothetical protein n=3 Tax=Glaesserella parasuis TaxID=738 RepID=UPI002436D903|nr:hypothetical protein [Glaesserella parasuis]MDG6483466.1 hypothetical protein [Glaesserella parasuis]MDG6483467.1 hypothetical protein [Glaesserella parasuis]MDG6805931.1 hypothetical protein [Glaesserella parasuis]MDG6871406.1 hypothetical protein [Glaesserella parasuis]